MTLTFSQEIDPRVSHDKFIIQDSLWIITEPVGVPIYDFDFRQFFECRTPYEPQKSVSGVARVGAFEDYEASTGIRESFFDTGQKVHTERHRLALTAETIITTKLP